MRLRQARESLAVMLHHRGLTLRQLEKPEDAKRDLSRAEQLGYNPAKGVF
jgi:hypothetical protein